MSGLRPTRLPAPVWFGLRLAITVAVLIVLWHAVGGGAVATTLAQATPGWMLAAVLALVTQTALSAQRWRLTAAQLGQSLPLGYALREYFLSQAFNQALPGAVAGDAARAVRARDGVGLLVSGQAVLFERLAGQIAMFATLSLAFVATVTVAGGLDWPPGVQTPLALVICGGAILPVLAWGLSVARGRAPAWLRPLGVALFARRVVLAQCGFGAAITLCNLAAFAFAARAVGVELSAVEVVALVPIVLFAMLIPVTVSGWGLREGAAALILPLAGVSGPDSVAASILFGLAMLISVLPGVLMVMAR